MKLDPNTTNCHEWVIQTCAKTWHYTTTTVTCKYFSQVGRTLDRHNDAVNTIWLQMGYRARQGHSQKWLSIVHDQSFCHTQWEEYLKKTSISRIVIRRSTPAFAKEHNYEFTAGVESKISQQYQTFSLFRKGRSKRGKNFLKQNQEDTSIHIFDYSFTIGSGKNNSTCIYTR